MIRRQLRIKLRRQLLQPRRRTMLQGRGRAHIRQIVEVAHRSHPLRIGRHVAKPPPRHAERLAESRHDDRAFPHPIERSRTNVLRSVVDEVLINLIGEDEQIMLARSVCNRFEFARD